MTANIEKFPVKKTSIHYEEEPELFFFAPDEEEEEADFIRVDDLFSLEEQVPNGDVILTLFPARRCTFIKGDFARAVTRTLAMSALRLERPADDIRVRPLFVQWRVELEPGDDSEQIAREIRADLEEQAHILLKLNDNERFWAAVCLIRPAEKDHITIAQIVKMVGDYQEDL